MFMKTIKSLSIYILAFTAMATTGCKKYLDINQDPSVARTVTPQLLLSSAQINVASALAVDLNINGSIWGQYWTQSPTASQYKIYEQYLPNASEYDREWGLLYNGAIADLKRMDSIATEQKQSQYSAVAKIMQAYTFQLITDAWGDVPFSEAGRGNTEAGAILAPKFDRQEAVYDGIVNLLDQGIALIDPANEIHPSSDDLLFSGDMDMWLKFANSLKLKAYLRQAGIAPGKAQAGIASMAGQPMLGAGEDAQISFISTAGNQNPLYSEIVGLNFTQNLVASATSTDSMIANEDWRRYVVYTVPGADVVGLAQGNYNASSTSTLSFPSAVTGAEARNTSSAEARVVFMGGYESLFLQAEAAARGWMAGDGEELFYEGIAASFDRYAAEISALEIQLSDSPEVFLNAGLANDIYVNGDTALGVEPAYWAQYPAGGSTEQKVRHIVTQKWFAMNGTQGFEAWTEWRRTGYPDFFVYSATSIIGNTFPGSFLYPNTELTRNTNFPGQKQVATKVWWDVN
jgi:hypothetical protein